MPSEQFELTPAEAAALLRKAPTGARFAVHIRGDAPIAGKPGFVLPGALSGYVNLSRADAARLAAGMLQEGSIARGARIPVSIHRYTVGDEEPRVTYWIG